MDENWSEADAVEYASRAVEFDRSGMVEAAIFYYREAAAALHFLHRNSPTVSAKVKSYLDRADELEASLGEKSGFSVLDDQNKMSSPLYRAKFLLAQALDEDEEGDSEDALQLYLEAVELCLEARKSTDDAEVSQKLADVAKLAVARAETIKGISAAPSAPLADDIDSIESSMRSLNAFQPSVARHSASQSNSAAVSSNTKLKVSGSAAYTKEELQVLRKTSIINGREYVPFLGIDRHDRFALMFLFEDPDGKLPLSGKQRAAFKQWVRISELSPDPKIIQLIDCYSIKQTCITDCSFVASLAVSALYEKRFKKKIITSIIYPQNRAGDPVYNPCGKYTVKLNINGVARKVVIDDYLPLGRYGELLCSYSNNKGEFWVSLLEKAYLKVMGGYDFPGSNSNIDLHALTGWIPDRISLDVRNPTFNKDAAFNKILDRHGKGDCLVTFATKPLNDEEADRSGLVSSHAYAMLDVKRVLGQRLFLLKNPWSHLRWKGRFSERDIHSWTPELAEALHYNPKSAQMFDNGVFWIDYDSVCHFFEAIYLNWNPALFQYTFCTHSTWSAGSGPVRDVYNIGENPQYSLNISKPGCAVWILLTRHITDRDDFANNREYIAVVVYKGGKKVYIPHDPPPYIDGARINSPHYLTKIVVPEGTGEQRYTLVISQYEKSTTIHYTLRAYCTVPFQLVKLKNIFTHKQEESKGSWTKHTSGGCRNHQSTYALNPIYQLQVESPKDDNQVLIILKGPKQYQVGFDVVPVSVRNVSGDNADRLSSGLYRSGFTVLEISQMSAGLYNIIPTTFSPGQEGPFILTIQANCPIKLSRLK